MNRLMIRMTAPVIATSLLLLVVGVGAAWYVHRLQHRVSDELTSNFSSLRAAEELVINLQQIRALLDHFLLTGNRKYLDDLPPFRTKTEHWLVEADRWGTSAKEKQMVARAKRGLAAFSGQMGTVMKEAPASWPPKIQHLIDSVLIREILEPTQNYLTLNATESEESIGQNEVFAQRLTYAFLLLGTCGSGAGLVAGLGFARAFQRSLVQLSVPIRAAAGHLEDVVGPVTFVASADLYELEIVLRTIADRIGTVMERLRQSEREALRAEQLAAVGQMAAGVAHELRNPLTSMKILVQAALSGDGRSEARDGDESDYSTRPKMSHRDLTVLEEEIGRLERLIQSFLEFARPPQLEKRTLDVRPLIEDAVNFLRDRAAACATRIEYRMPAHAVLAAVDPAQFRQVLLNLIVNALDAVRSGGMVWVDLNAEGNGWLSLRVSDNGRGLPAALGDRIFTPFTTTKETGLGLGLSISKRIVEDHVGSLTATNRTEGGAVFVVRLPRVVDCA